MSDHEEEMRLAADNLSRLSQEMLTLNSTINNVTSPSENLDQVTLSKKELELRQKEIDLLRREMELTISRITAASSLVTPRADKQIFSFNDIEGSMEKFSGTEGYLLEKWLKDLEDAAHTYGWSDIQLVTYAKRLLEGDARKVLRTRAHISNWQELKAFLNKEFKPTHTSATVHRQMAERKKRGGESFLSYLISMMTLGKTIEMEEAAVIEYCIGGILDYEPNKAVLYGATTIAEFKKRLTSYEEIKCKTASRRSSSPGPSSQSLVKSSRSRRSNDRAGKCYICGELGHLANVCPHKGKGSKCFNCQEFGHIAPKCPNRKEKVVCAIEKETAISEDERKVIYAVKQQEVSAKREEKLVVLDGVEVYAMVDNGSDLNFIASRKLLEIGSHDINPKVVTFRGVGSGSLKTSGSVNLNIEIDGDTFQTTFHIVKDGLLPVDVVLGQELLRRTITILTPHNITIRKFAPELAAIAEVISSEEEVDVSHIRDKKLAQEVLTLIANYCPRKEAVSEEIKMHIVVASDSPVYTRPRRLAPLEFTIVRNQIDEWMNEGIIRASVSEYASPIVLANKKDGTKRLCVDYRRLNAVIVRDRYPLPLIEDQIDRLQGATYFSTLDLRNGFFHIPIATESIKYTSFVTPFGQYEFLRAPFGLCNSPAAFQRFINKVFSELWVQKIVCVYMDDIIIPAGSEEESVRRLKKVLEVAQQNGLQIKWTKCKLLEKTVEYLGYEITSDTIRPSKEKQAAILKFPVPNSVRQCQRLLGLTGYFRKFVKGYALIAKPISDLLRKDVPFRFGEQAKNAMNTLKKTLTTEPVLQIYSLTARTELQTDASKYGLGAILVQESSEDNQLHPVFYYSRKTSKCEENYCSYELEVLAIVSALKKFRVYLLGLKFKIATDCAAFKGTMERRELSSRIAGWALILQEFDYELEHRPAHRMRHVDALSRAPVMMVIQADVSNRIKAAQRDDESIQTILKLLETSAYNSYERIHGILFKVVKGTSCLVVPRAMQSEVIRNYHGQGHFGPKKTEELIRREFWMQNLNKKVTAVIKNCIHCILVNRKEGRQDGLLNSIPKGEHPFTTYHVDHLGHLTATKKRYQYIFCVVDAFTKFVWLYPTKGTTAKETMQKLGLQKAIFGNPKCIVSDRAAAFTSTEFQEYCKSEGIDQHLITTGMPSGNGQVERLNRVIIPVLAKLAREEPENWWKYVDRVQRYINNSHQRAINRSPFELLFGVRMNAAEDMRIKEAIEMEAAELFSDTREEMRESSRRAIEQIQAENKKIFDRKRRRAPTYSVGDWVVIKRTQFGAGQKIAEKYIGPYEVVRVKENDRYDVRRTNQSTAGPINTSTSAEYLKLYFEGQTESEDSENDSGPAKANEEPTTDESDFLGFPDEELEGHPGRMSSRMAE